MLTFRLGGADEPRGHAFLFFRDADDQDVVWATYLVVAPIAMDLAKYIPAAFASQMPVGGLAQAPTAYPLPPMPEKVEGGVEWVERTARLRGDDVLDGGVIRVADPWQMLQPISGIAQEYAERYNAHVEQAPELASRDSPPAVGAGGAASASVDVDDLLLQVMPDREKVGRVARLAGTLRYAVEGGDRRQVEETVAEMERIGRRLADKYRLPELITAARSADSSGGALAQLYLERCYRLADEDYAALPDIERKIEALRAQQP